VCDFLINKIKISAIFSSLKVKIHISSVPKKTKIKKSYFFFGDVVTGGAKKNLKHGQNFNFKQNS
jgi:hypothetical protein